MIATDEGRCVALPAGLPCRSDIAPTSCLAFESEEVMRLHWLPLAVRHKLDEEGLRLTLEQWQALPTAAKADLLARMPEAGFARAARAAGARIDTPARTRQGEIDGAELARCFGLDPYDAHEWLSRASSFARFVAAKRIRSIQP